METLACWVLNLFFGSIFTFYGSLLLLFLVRPLIKSPRALYFLYLIPIFKTASDAIFSSHRNGVLFFGESILQQPENSRSLSACLAYEGTYPFVALKFHLENGHSFSIGDVISETFPSFVTMGLFTFLIIGSFAALFHLGMQLFSNLRFSKELKRKLLYWKCYKKCPVYLTNEDFHSPFILGIWKPIIVFPKRVLAELSPKEEEAVLTHEVGHALWKDNLVQWVSLILHTLFWFIPFKRRWFKKACHHRELGCDNRCDLEALAGAIYKTGATSLPQVGIAFSTSYDRFQRAFYQKREGKWTFTFSLIFLICGGTLVFLSQFLPF